MLSSTFPLPSLTAIPREVHTLTSDLSPLPSLRTSRPLHSPLGRITNPPLVANSFYMYAHLVFRHIWRIQHTLVAQISIVDLSHPATLNPVPTFSLSLRISPNLSIPLSYDLSIALLRVQGLRFDPYGQPTCLRVQFARAESKSRRTMLETPYGTSFHLYFRHGGERPTLSIMVHVLQENAKELTSRMRQTVILCT